MATVIELVGEELGDKNGRLVFQVHDVTDALVARALANSLAPIYWNGLVKHDVQIRELGDGVWEGDVPYGTLERREQGNVSWSFEIGTQSLKITQAREHVQSYAASGTAPDHKGAIGVRNDGNGGQSIEGCDVFVPFFKWTETHYFYAGVVATHSWVQTHEALVGTVNQDPFRIWQKGELLLLGVTAQKQAEAVVPVTYSFASSRTKTGMTIGDISGVDKEGHHYLWIEYWSEEDATAKDLAHRPKAVHVEQVYEYADWQTYLPLADPWS